jgi:hypothetical protein
MLLATDRTFADPCYDTISESKASGCYCDTGAWRRVIDSLPNDDGSGDRPVARRGFPLQKRLC